MLLTVVFLKAGFLTGPVGFAIALFAEASLAFKIPLAEVGVPFAGALVKKLAIVRCPEDSPALEFCFFNAGVRAGVASPLSFFFPILVAD